MNKLIFKMMEDHDDDEIGIYDEFMKELIIKMTMRIIIMMTAMMMRRL